MNGETFFADQPAVDATVLMQIVFAGMAIGENPDKTGYVLSVPDSDGARGITERYVRIGAVLLERTMTLLNCHDLDIDGKRQFPMHQIQRAEALPGTRQALLPGVSRRDSPLVYLSANKTLHTFNPHWRTPGQARSIPLPSTTFPTHSETPICRSC